MQQRVRAVGRAVMRRAQLVVVQPGEELDLEPGGHLQARRGGGRHLLLQRPARIECPRLAVGVDHARGRPGEPRLAG
jgi:hypothetical protein